jgi:sugar/nucleoside kinase (ribokinase family)
MNYDLIGIGNALVDIEVRVEDSFIETLGLTKGGMTLYSAEDQKKVLQSLAGEPQKISSGGSAANTVHGLSVLGGDAYYLGRVAGDTFGHHYTDDMQECGVGFPGPGAESEGTGTCVVLISPDAERTMLTHLGVSSALHPDNIDETILSGAKAVYIEGYLWTGDETREAATKMATLAKQNGIPVAFTLSDAFVVNLYKDSLLDFIRWHVDILFCNEMEALSITGAGDAETAFPLIKSMADTLFLTIGKKGAIAGNSSDVTACTGVFPITAVDSTGAGDLFAAGALYGIINNHTLKEASIIGSYCAAQVVSHMGARLPVHSHTEVEKILAEYSRLDLRSHD